MRNEQWRWRPLGELFEIGSGKTMSSAARAGSDKTPFLRTSNVLWDEVDLTQVDEMAISPRELLEKHLRTGDLLVCEGGEVGRAAIWKGDVPTMSFQNHIHRLRSSEKDIEPRFYVYFLQSAFTQLGIFEGAGNKTTIPNLSRNRLAALEVPQPPLGEQQALAAVLAWVRSALKAQSTTVKCASELKRATMRELFTRGLGGGPLIDTAIGQLPANWKQTNLGDLCSTGGGRIQTGPFGSQLHASDYERHGVPVVNPTHLDGDRINHAEVPRVSVGTADRLDRHRLELGDILFARRGEIGRHGLVGSNECGWLCGTGCFLVRIRDKRIDNAFVSRLFSIEGVVSWLASNASGSIMPNLNNVVLARLPVLIPSLEEQREIVAILDAIDKKIDLHRRKRAVLEDLFKALLHKLMTGEIRVSDLDLSALQTPTTGGASS